MGILGIITSIAIVAVLLALAGIGVAYFGRLAWFGITHFNK